MSDTRPKRPGTIWIYPKDMLQLYVTSDMARAEGCIAYVPKDEADEARRELVDMLLAWQRRDQPMPECGCSHCRFLRRRDNIIARYAEEVRR